MKQISLLNELLFVSFIPGAWNINVSVNIDN